MVKNKNILIPVLLIAVMLSASCSRNEVIQKFPVGEDGYPQKNIVLINEVSYELAHYDEVLSGGIGESEIFIDPKSQQLEILLPVVGALTEWSVEENGKINLIHDSLLNNDIESAENEPDKFKDGGTAAIQKFVFSVPKKEKTTIVFKHININEKEKAFSDRQYDYRLKITLND